MPGFLRQLFARWIDRASAQLPTGQGAVPVSPNPNPHPNAPDSGNAVDPADDAPDEVSEGARDFIRQIVAEDNASGKWGGQVVTRFPPEPNGYLHIGHAKAIAMDFGIAAENGGRCHLRFDDTNPVKEEQAFVDGIKRDLRWLGYDWGEHEYYASDYFQQLYDYAVELVKAGKAFVCDLSAEEMREYRGTLTEPGRESPYRNRSIEENLDLLGRMAEGEFDEGSRTLRAKIDMASPNINLRDPVMYRILHAHHHRTGDTWHIYPSYDWAHGQSDSIEGITHSMCTLEFEDHRPLYDWFLDQLGIHHPQQIEFARVNIGHTITSKRKLARLVAEGVVSGWDDPRMPTLAGLRRRGVPPEAIRTFLDDIGLSKRERVVELSRMEYWIRQVLNRDAERRLGVLDPLKVVLENWPADEVDHLDAINNPEDESAGTRLLPFSRELWIERTDFMEDPPRKFKRLTVGREVRLRYGYFITCTEAIKDPETGEVVELRATVDRETRGGQAPDGRKVRGTIHWLSAAHAVPTEFRLYDTLFTVSDPRDMPEGGDVLDSINPDSLTVVEGYVEPALAAAEPGTRVQLERTGYFAVDADATPERPVLNRTVGLRDTWKKMQGK